MPIIGEDTPLELVIVLIGHLEDSLPKLYLSHMISCTHVDYPIIISSKRCMWLVMETNRRKKKFLHSSLKNHHYYL